MEGRIKGFSKLTKEAKVEWLVDQFFEGAEEARELLHSYLHPNPKRQKVHDEFIENTLTNFYMPFGVAPNFNIDGEMYCLPLAIEESSVVAAAAKAAGYWLDRGGFKTEIISTTKIGHVHFIWDGDKEEELAAFFESIKESLVLETESLTKNMRARGGGILDIELKDCNDREKGYHQIEARFETCDSMGANFINSILEEFSKVLTREISSTELISDPAHRSVSILMCILSNYTPECLVRAEVSCPVEELEHQNDGLSGMEFAEKFIRAIRIATIEPYRAVTHNKGIMNGIDSVIIATGNDFRAVEACAHAYAAKDGAYKSLTHATIEDGIFKFWIEIPLALGTVGGITGLHPIVKLSHSLLRKPNARTLMGIVASAGLAQNFSAVRALVTSGIQKGHMKMHLLNILNQLEATEEEKAIIVEYFKDKIPSHSAAVQKFCELRGIREDQTTLHKK